MEFTLRPFERTTPETESCPSLKLRGAVEDDAFVFTVDGARFPIPLVRLGQDEHGPFAIVEDSEREVQLGFRLSVDVDADEDRPEGPHGCRISLRKPHPDQEAWQAAKPWANVLMPVDSAVSVYFSDLGFVNGWSGGSSSWETTALL